MPPEPARIGLGSRPWLNRLPILHSMACCVLPYLGNFKLLKSRVVDGYAQAGFGR
jgi:hypothetical protein